MGFLKKLWDKLNNGFFYVVDIETLKAYLDKQPAFAMENDLVLAEELNVYLGGEKHLLEVLNYYASEEKEEQYKGIIFNYDDEEFHSLDDLFNEKFRNAPQYFKIEMIDGAPTELEKYKESHPELNVEDY